MRRRVLSAAAAAVVVVIVLVLLPDREVTVDLRAQVCGLPAKWLELVRRGYHPDRSGQIALLPRRPAYMASGAGGWSHSGPWDYLQRVPLLFYGPGLVAGGSAVDRPVSLADVAPTFARVLGMELEETDGAVLGEVPRPERRPRLIVTVVWDGGGWNTLEHWGDSWPVLARLLGEGISFTRASVGSSPSVTPAVHSTLGTGFFPATHGITGVPLRDDNGEVVDAFLKGESSRFLRRPTIGEIWDELKRGRPEIGMVGYEPWHLGMIGAGAETPGGDADHAAWLDVETNEWITNESHYELPAALAATPGLEEELKALDASDGAVDSRWMGHDVIADRARIEETPAFVRYHTRALLRMIRSEGYGRDPVTDLLYTNYKQIDRVGHYFNMDSPEVRAVLEETDRALATLVNGLDRTVGRGRWLLVLTADHGQQPDAAAIDGYGIRPRELEDDIDAEFGPVTTAAWPTEIFLDEAALARHDVEPEAIATWLAGYSVGDNRDPEQQVAMDDHETLFELAVPSELLPRISCPG